MPNSPGVPCLITAQSCCIQFQNLSVDSVGTITAYHWDFGDVDISNISDPLHCYPVTGTFIVYMFVTSSSGVDTAIHPLTITHLDTTGCNCDSLIGVNEISARNFAVYIFPNPFHDKTTISLHTELNKNLSEAEIRIYNSIGVMVRKENVALDKKQELVFERESLPPGIYYFEISSEGILQAAHGKLLIK
jgi:PKD repeat protein